MLLMSTKRRRRRQIRTSAGLKPLWSFGPVEATVSFSEYVFPSLFMINTKLNAFVLHNTIYHLDYACQANYK
jgi:hypothetical protein